MGPRILLELGLELSTDPSGLKIEEAQKLNFQATNNEVEYEALIYGLGLAKQLRVKLLKVRSDSKLIAMEDLKLKSPE